MLFSKDKVDDDDFNIDPDYRSNLDTIFGNSGSDGNPSLTYTAPKQPKRIGLNKPLSGATRSTSSSSPNVIIAKAVHTFKMVDKKYQSQGKLGAALLSGKSVEDGPYQLLLYQGKQQQVCVSRISRDTNFLVQPRNYCTFYDSLGAIWSILFDSVLEMTEFTFHVALARWRSGDLKSPIMFQDLWCPTYEDPKLCSTAVGDSVELSYTLHSTNSNSQGLEEVQNVFVKVEGSGWTQGLVGMQPNAKRAIFLQPFMLGDLNPNEVVYNSSVVLKLTMVNISKIQENPPPPKQVKEEQHNKRKNNPPNLNSEPAPGDTPVNNSSPKGSPKATKADLISRMARMGQALPFKTATPGISDSDETEDDHKVERLVPKPRTRVQHAPALPSSPVNTVVAAAPSLSTSVALAQQHPVPVQWASASYMGGMYPVPQIQSPSEIQTQTQFNIFFSEVRTTNSELRMGITRLTDKVEALQNKFDNNSEKRPSQDMSSVLERLLENDQQLKDQLHLMMTALNNSEQPFSQRQPSGESTVHLTTENCKHCTEKYEAHEPINFNSSNRPTEEEICLLERTSENSHPSSQSRSNRETTVASVENCQLCMEKDKAYAVLCEKVKSLEEENSLKSAHIKTHELNLDCLVAANENQEVLMGDLQNQLREEQDRTNAAYTNLNSLATEKEHLAQELEKANTLIKELQNTTQDRQSCMDKSQQTIIDNEVVKVEEMRRNLQDAFDPKPVIGEHIKKILNAVYRLVKLQFEPEYKYDTAFIQSVLAETIKAVTLEYLENGNLLLAEKKQSLSKTMHVGQTQSAPVFTSEQKKEERNGGQYMNMDQPNGAELGVKLSKSANAEMPSTSKFTTPQETNATSQYAHSRSTQNDSGGDQEVNAVNINQSSSDLGAQCIKPPVDVNSSVNDSGEESSDDVWRQPPPVPLFDEEENDDDWINSY